MAGSSPIIGVAPGFPSFELKDPTSATSYPKFAILDSFDTVWEQRTKAGVLEARARRSIIFHLEISALSINSNDFRTFIGGESIVDPQLYLGAFTASASPIGTVVAIVFSGTFTKERVTATMNGKEARVECTATVLDDWFPFTATS